jgi:ribosomal protein S27AE
MTTERVHFKLLVMPCCSTLLCHVNPRLPNFCPECGTSVMAEIKSCIMTDDDNATLRYREGMLGFPTKV